MYIYIYIYVYIYIHIYIYFYRVNSAQQVSQKQRKHSPNTGPRANITLASSNEAAP